MFWKRRIGMPIEKRLRPQPTCATVKEVVRIQFAGFRLVAFSSLETHLLDDTHAKEPLPPTYETAILRLVIENEWSWPSDPTRIVLRACYVDGSTFKKEEIAVPALAPGEGIARSYPSMVTSFEIEDWWLERAPEYRST
jgi:hypothetical protein